MSGSVGTMRAGSNRHSGTKEKMTKNKENTSQQQQQTAGKVEAQSNKVQPTQEQLRLAQMMNTNQTDVNFDTVKELMEMTGKSENVVVFALHDAENDADRAVMMLLEGGDEQGELREQAGKRKKKANTSSQKDGSNHVGDDHFEGRNRDRGDRDDKDRDGASDRHDVPPRRGRRNGGPPPRLARGRGRDRGNFGDRDNRERNSTEDWDNEKSDDRRDRSGGDRGRSRGRGGFGGRKSSGPTGGRGRFNNSSDRDNRGYNRVPRFDKMNNSQPIDGPEIDTWTNETAETNTSKDTDWDNWNDTWVNEDGDQWTGSVDKWMEQLAPDVSHDCVTSTHFFNMVDSARNTFLKLFPDRHEDFLAQRVDLDFISSILSSFGITKTNIGTIPKEPVLPQDLPNQFLDETKVFTPSQMKIQEPDPVIADPPSSLGQRLDVGSLFIESAKYSKAPDYSKPTGDAYITQFNQAATESIKNTIGIGSSARPPQSLSSLAMPQQSATNSLGLSSLTQSSGQVQSGVGVLSSLPQQANQPQMTQLSQISQSVSQAMSQIGMESRQAQIGSIGSQQVNREQVPPAQSRIPSVMQQQQQQQHQQQQQQNIVAPSNMSNNLQQRPKPQKSKLPPPSKIPASAVEMPGHIPRNTQLDLQFGIDFGSDSSSSFGFGASTDTVAVTSTYSTTSNGTSSVISNHLSQAHVSKANTDGSSMVPSIMSSPSAGSNKVPSAIEPQQSNRSPAVFHNSVYTASPPKNESQSLEREQNKLSGPEAIPFPSQLERKSSPMMSQRPPGQTAQNLTSVSLPQNKNETPSNYSTANGYAPSTYQSHQKASSMSQTQSYTHTTNSQPPQGSSFAGQYPASQSAYPSAGQSQFSAPPSATQFPPAGTAPQYNNAQNQYSSGQNQFPSAGSSSHPPMPHANHQSQYSTGAQNSYTSGGQSQYSGYQNSASFPSHPPSQPNFPSSNQSSGPGSSLYPASTQPGGSFTSQSNSYQSSSSGSYHSRDNQTNVPVTTQASSGVSFPTAPQSSSLKPATSQTNTNYNSQSFTAPPAPLQPLQTNKIGESLSKMTLKDTSSLDGHQSSQYDHSSASTTTVSTALTLPSATSTASLSTGTTTISSTSTATSITSSSRIASMPSTSKAPPNLPPGVPLMGQYIMGQSTMPPFYSVQPPLYGYEDVQLLQQRMPLVNQTGSYYDMSAFPAPAGSTLPAGRDQQPQIPNVSFSGHYAPFSPLKTGTSADTSKMPRVDAQSPNSSSQPQNAHSTAQQPLINFHYGYYYPSMFPGAAGLQYPMFPIPPVTNAAAHAGTTATTQFQKTYPSHVYTTKGYDELNQAQDFSKTGYGSSSSGGKSTGTRTGGSSDITPNAYSKSHTQAFDKQGFHGGTPPPFNLPLATATQAGPMGAPTTPYGAPFLPVMAAHQAHSQMMHHPIQQDSSSSSSRGLNQTGNQAKTGTAKSYGGPPYWNN